MENPNQTITAKRLKELRKGANLSIDKLASELNKKITMDVRKLYRYEADNGKTPSVDELVYMSKFFNVSIDYLTGLSDDKGNEMRDTKDAFTYEEFIKIVKHSLSYPATDNAPKNKTELAQLLAVEPRTLNRYLYEETIIPIQRAFIMAESFLLDLDTLLGLKPYFRLIGEKVRIENYQPFLDIRKQIDQQIDTLVDSTVYLIEVLHWTDKEWEERKDAANRIENIRCIAEKSSVYKVFQEARKKMEQGCEEEWDELQITNEIEEKTLCLMATTLSQDVAVTVHNSIQLWVNVVSSIYSLDNLVQSMLDPIEE